MWLDRIGWAGTPFDRKLCIHIDGLDQKHRRLELALTPETELQEAWDALVTCGVHPDPAKR
jgi:hypothetical protein